MTARQYFDGVRRASEEVERCQRIIGELSDGETPVQSGGGPRGKGETSDPVWAAFSARERALADATARMDAAQELIGEALALIEGLRRVYCRKADVLELRYIDLLPWAAVADRLGVTERTVYLWRDEVLRFVDSTPRVYILGLRCGDGRGSGAHC